MELPDAFLEVIDAVARERLGRRDALGADLAERVERVSHAYTRERGGLAAVASDPALMAARLRFYLPRDAMKAWWPLRELDGAGALPERETVRVLDLGAGLGAMTFGAALAVGERASLDVIAVDTDPAVLDLMRALADRSRQRGLFSVSVKTRTRELSSEAALDGGPFDLVLIGLALNEWRQGRSVDEAVDLLERCADALAPDGTLIVVEPALRAQTRALHAMRDALVKRKRVSVFAPCLRGGECPMLARERDWCHEDRPYALPASLVPIARAAGLRYERSTFSYLSLRRDGRTLREALPSDAGELYRVVGRPKPSKGKLEVIGCGRPGGQVLARLDRHRSAANEAFERAQRGDVLALEPGPGPGERVRVAGATRARVLRPAEAPSSAGAGPDTARHKRAVPPGSDTM